MSLTFVISFYRQYKEYLIILSVFGGFLSLPRRHKLHIFRARAFINLFAQALNHSAAPPLPKKSCRLFVGPGMYCLRSKISRFHLNCYAPAPASGRKTNRQNKKPAPAGFFQFGIMNCELGISGRADALRIIINSQGRQSAARHNESRLRSLCAFGTSGVPETSLPAGFFYRPTYNPERSDRQFRIPDSSFLIYLIS